MPCKMMVQQSFTSATYLGVVKVAGDALQDDGSVPQGGSHLTEAQVELGSDGTQGL